MPVQQSFENHAKFVPLFHYVAAPILLINLVWSIVRVVRTPSVDSVIALLVAWALILIFFHARLFALTVQDRVIRLEMQLRLAKLLPPDLLPRIPEFGHKQLVALRFAPDDELPDLCRKVLTDKITDQRQIKRLIRKWNPDYLRA